MSKRLRLWVNPNIQETPNILFTLTFDSNNKKSELVSNSLFLLAS